MFTHLWLFSYLLSNMRTKVKTNNCLTLYKEAEAITLNVKIVTRFRLDTIEAIYIQLTHQKNKDSYNRKKTNTDILSPLIKDASVN